MNEGQVMIEISMLNKQYKLETDPGRKKKLLDDIAFYQRQLNDY